MSLPRGGSVQQLAQQFGTRRTVNRSINSSAAKEGRVCGIDDGIDIESGDVGVNGLDCRRRISAICGEQGGSRFARGLALAKEPTHFMSP
jgi:hypothetical protein